MSWGWRLPFLASAVLILVGIFVRSRVEESPAFVAVRAAHRRSSFPARDVFIGHRRALLLTFGAKLGEVTLYFTLVVFAVSYALSTLKFARAEVLEAVMMAAALQIVTIPMFGWLGDRIGSQRLYAAGGFLLAITAVPIFMAIAYGSLASFTVAIVIGLALNYAIMFGPQSELYGAQFPAELRYSGMSLGIQLAAAVGGGLAPIIATGLLARYRSVVPVGVYLAALGLLATICALSMKRPEKQ